MCINHYMLLDCVLWFVREIEKIDVVGLCRFQSSLPPGFVTHNTTLVYTIRSYG